MNEQRDPIRDASEENSQDESLDHDGSISNRPRLIRDLHRKKKLCQSRAEPSRQAERVSRSSLYESKVLRCGQQLDNRSNAPGSIVS